MNRSGRTTIRWLLPLFLLLASCDNPIAVEVVEEEPAAVETCEWLIPIGIDLVNDYFYTLQEIDLGPSQGDQSKVPREVLELNARGADLDRRAAELECDLQELNTAIVEATSGLESTDPVLSVLLETVRGGVVGAVPLPVGSWVLVNGALRGEPIELAPEQSITLVVDQDGSGSGFTGCNSYDIFGAAVNGEWPVVGYVQDAGPCPSDAHTAAEGAYAEAIQQVREYLIADDTLELTGSGVELVFVRQVG